MMGLSCTSESLQGLGIRDQQESPKGLQPRSRYDRLSAGLPIPMTRMMTGTAYLE